MDTRSSAPLCPEQVCSGHVEQQYDGILHRTAAGHGNTTVGDESSPPTSGSHAVPDEVVLVIIPTVVLPMTMTHCRCGRQYSPDLPVGIDLGETVLPPCSVSVMHPHGKW